MVKEEIEKEVNDFLEFNKNDTTTYPNLWDVIKAVLRGKLIVLSASKKKLERAYTNSLTVHLKALEQKEEDISKKSRQQEIIKLRAEINQIEIEKSYFPLYQQRAWCTGPVRSWPEFWKNRGREC